MPPMVHVVNLREAVTLDEIIAQFENRKTPEVIARGLIQASTTFVNPWRFDKPEWPKLLRFLMRAAAPELFVEQNDLDPDAEHYPELREEARKCLARHALRHLGAQDHVEKTIRCDNKILDELTGFFGAAPENSDLTDQDRKPISAFLEAYWRYCIVKGKKSDQRIINIELALVTGGFFDTILLHKITRTIPLLYLEVAKATDDMNLDLTWNGYSALPVAIEGPGMNGLDHSLLRKLKHRELTQDILRMLALCSDGDPIGRRRIVEKYARPTPRKELLEMISCFERWRREALEKTQ